MPSSILTIWFSKAICGLLFMLLAQTLFFFALIVFCNAAIYIPIIELLTILLLVDIGMATCGALLGSLAVGHTGKESLLTVVLFPLLTPLLLAGIEIFSSFFTVEIIEYSSWLGIVLAFDALFTALALLLFPFIYTPEE